MAKLALLLLGSAIALGVEVPALTGRVVDLSGTLAASEQAQLTQDLAALEAQRGAQGAILLPKSLEGSDIESYALAVVEKWKLGHKGKDDGFLIVISPAERRGRIEVGYGLEGEITDAFAKRLLSDVGTPYFKTGNYGGGLKAIVAAISDKLGGVDSLPPPQNRRVVSKMIHYRDFFFVIIFLLIAFFQAIFGRHRRSGFRSGGGYWGGGGGFGGGGGWSGGGGGGFSGGGGGFGGGGSSSSW